MIERDSRDLPAARAAIEPALGIAERTQHRPLKGVSELADALLDPHR
jgi:hypothetical protein